MPEKDNNCSKAKKRCCIDIIIFVLSILIAFTVGVIIGAVTGLFALIGLGAIIVLIVILVILLVIRILTLVCCRQKCE